MDKNRSLVTWSRQHWLIRGFLGKNNDLVHPPEYISKTALSKTSHNKPNKKPICANLLPFGWLSRRGQDVASTDLSPLVLSQFFLRTRKSPDPLGARMHTTTTSSSSQSVSQDKHGRQSLRKHLGISALKFALLKRGLNTDPRRPLKPLRRTEFSTRWVRAVSLTAVTPSIIRQWISFTRHGIFSESRALYFVTRVCSYICLWDVIILCLKWMHINQGRD